MTDEPNHPVELKALQKKLEAIRESLAALSPLELRALIDDPSILGAVVGAPQGTALAGLDQKMRDRLADVDAQDPASAPIVEVTREQREEARRLQMEIWRKQGVVDEVIGLAQLHGERRDPFADQDPEPPSDTAD